MADWIALGSDSLDVRIGRKNSKVERSTSLEEKINRGLRRHAHELAQNRPIAFFENGIKDASGLFDDRHLGAFEVDRLAVGWLIEELSGQAGDAPRARAHGAG